MEVPMIVAGGLGGDYMSMVEGGKFLHSASIGLVSSTLSSAIQSLGETGMASPKKICSYIR